MRNEAILISSRFLKYAHKVVFVENILSAIDIYLPLNVLPKVILANKFVLIAHLDDKGFVVREVNVVAHRFLNKF